jgi:alpha-beta hydrolase superfamily lysophospholipase
MRLLKVLRIAAGVLVGASLLTLAGPLVGETIATFPPIFPKKGANSMEELGLSYEDVAFPTTDGLVLRGWFIPANEPEAAAIVYAPATGHDQRSGLSLVPALHEAGYHMLLFSYRGHALSDGVRGRFTYGDAESRDVDAAVEFLRRSMGIHEVGIIGHSAGAASAILSAARNPHVAAVVAVAPFNCVTEVWHTSWPTLVPSFILDWTLWASEKLKGFDRQNVCPVDVVDRIAPRPLLVIHGTEDRRITEAQIQRLFGAAREPKSLWLVQGATHDGVRTLALDQLVPDVISFFDKALLAQENPLEGVTEVLDSSVMFH